MKQEITLNIDGKQVKAYEGDTILNVARANDIFIPAICYLTRCSPTLACRVCLVEADGKRVYSCNAKAKDGMNVVINSDEINEERNAIMQVYDINHPLQCGVCDKSGECELQDNTLFMGVNEQKYAIPDLNRAIFNWGKIKYDGGLCIVCERCITVCKDMIGDAALKTVSRDGSTLDASYKDTMPKDAYTMWNKLNKSLVGTASGDANILDCIECGECISACPVGALVSSDFQYKSNAWELTSIPSACTHCSSTCQLIYDIKHKSTTNTKETIYRVKNDFHFVALCGAGRFGFDYQNESAKKDNKQFIKAVEAFKNANSISFTSNITNEEALI
ncbi:MAG: NADH-quinone oxidoreductase subunit, partial [Campylobacterota bacterium]|nr:NADH-quinone oxidoreductase subunit [Campylobacterota bacterium]